MTILPLLEFVFRWEQYGKLDRQFTQDSKLKCDIYPSGVIMDLIHYLFAPYILFHAPYTLDLLP